MRQTLYVAIPRVLSQRVPADTKQFCSLSYGVPRRRIHLRLFIPQHGNRLLHICDRRGM